MHKKLILKNNLTD